METVGESTAGFNDLQTTLGRNPNNGQVNQEEKFSENQDPRISVQSSASKTQRRLALEEITDTSQNADQNNLKQIPTEELEKIIRTGLIPDQYKHLYSGPKSGKTTAVATPLATNTANINDPSRPSPSFSQSAFEVQNQSNITTTFSPAKSQQFKSEGLLSHTGFHTRSQESVDFTQSVMSSKPQTMAGTGIPSRDASPSVSGGVGGENFRTLRSNESRAPLDDHSYGKAMKALQTKIRALEEENTELKTAVSLEFQKLNFERETFHSQHMTEVQLARENEMLAQSKLDGLEGKLQQYEVAKKSLDEERRMLTSQLTMVETEKNRHLEQNSLDKERFLNKINELTMILDNEKNMNADWRQKFNQVDEERMQFQKELELTKDAHAALKSEVDFLREKSREQFNQESEHEQQWKAEMDHIKENFENQKISLEKTLNYTQQLLVEKEKESAKRIEALEEEKRVNDKTMATQKKEISKLKKEVTSLKNEKEELIKVKNSSEGFVKDVAQINEKLVEKLKKKPVLSKRDSKEVVLKKSSGDSAAKPARRSKTSMSAVATPKAKLGVKSPGRIVSRLNSGTPSSSKSTGLKKSRFRAQSVDTSFEQGRRKITIPKVEEESKQTKTKKSRHRSTDQEQTSLAESSINRPQTLSSPRENRFDTDPLMMSMSQHGLDAVIRREGGELTSSMLGSGDQANLASSTNGGLSSARNVDGHNVMLPLSRSQIGNTNQSFTYGGSLLSDRGNANRNIPVSPSKFTFTNSPTKGVNDLDAEGVVTVIISLEREIADYNRRYKQLLLQSQSSDTGALASLRQELNGIAALMQEKSEQLYLLKRHQQTLLRHNLNLE
eukprot:CAMPEP_0114997352 /NCGR_PEP_ID=MMETSP0216-20121206/14851_1 /TAXON_ID=223996 /ORGANISM="Protocruzia adherens, Strain Boccale" /LENGTH=839 /DNA_ID=CAMNT_0002361723 /DNA_START=72 /DNA_END=2591 /DNA_ORIENTATION=-